MIKHKFSTLIFISLLALYTGNASAAGKHNEPCDEISASSNIAVTQTQYGKVGGYLENNVFTFKGIPYAKAERFMPPTARTNGKASVVHGHTDLLVHKQNVWDGNQTNKLSHSTGMTVFQVKIVCV